MHDITCVLFAGGKSSRMGQDKSLLPFGDYSTLAEFQYHRLSQFFSNVYISTKSSEKFGFDAPFILDPIDVDYAPTAGFVSSFRALSQERFMAISVDTPFVDESVFTSLIQADRDDLDAVIARTKEGSHPLCGIYHRSLLNHFERMLREGDHRLGKLLYSSNTAYVEFDDEKVFMNLNHPDEYNLAYSINAIAKSR